MTATATEPGTPLPPLVTCCAEVSGEEFDALKAVVETVAQQACPGSPYLAEREIRRVSSTDNQTLWEEAHRTARRILLNLFDHLAMLTVALTGPRVPLYAHMTVSRVTAEAAAQICNLLSPTAGYQERVLRAARLGLRSRSLEVSAIHDLPDGHPVKVHALETTTRARDEFVAMVRRAGLDVRLRGDGRPAGIRRPGAGEYLRLDPSLTDLVNEQFPDRPAGYQLTSGVVHSMEWMLRDAITEDDADGIRAAPDLLGIGSATLVAVGAAAAVAEVYARLYGHDPAAAAAASATRRSRIDQACVQEFNRLHRIRPQ
ncbi:hypothetical protein [Sphaerisporangium aureirubrum]|uniref:DUF222 domain-containing protein n=1 Tax=Sphaerisporangium aureirubrum TaxID=1544736 RepID=A0ABW1NXB0_9ACTN